MLHIWFISVQWGTQSTENNKGIIIITTLIEIYDINSSCYFYMIILPPGVNDVPLATLVTLIGETFMKSNSQELQVAGNQRLGNRATYRGIIFEVLTVFWSVKSQNPFVIEWFQKTDQSDIDLLSIIHIVLIQIRHFPYRDCIYLHATSTFHLF